MNDRQSPEIPEFPTLTAELFADGSGQLTLPDGERELHGEDLRACATDALRLATEYASTTLKRAVRLQANDPGGVSLFGVHPDGTCVELAPRAPRAADTPPPNNNGNGNANGNGGDAPHRLLRPITGGRQESDPSPDPPISPLEDPVQPPPSRPAPASADGRPDRHAVHLDPAIAPPEEPLWPPAPRHAPASSPGRLDRRAVHPDRHGALGRLRVRLAGKLKDEQEREEEAADRELARRHTVSDTNFVVVCSNKGGCGKTAVTVEVGDALAGRLPNQRLLAADLNPGAGALAGVASEDRRAQKSIVELYDAKDEIDRHSKMQRYVASLQSGLSLLTVPPKVTNALAIRPAHYEELFDSVLVPNYDVILLDTSPDVTNPVTQLALDRGTQMVIVLEQDFLSSSVVIENLEYLLGRPAAGEHGSQATVVLNKVMSDPRAGDVDVTERAIRELHSGPVIRVPWDLDLRAQLNSGQYTLDEVRRRSTRLPIKQLAIEICQRLV